jgi:hypothetical protein
MDGLCWEFFYFDFSRIYLCLARRNICHRAWISNGSFGRVSCACFRGVTRILPLFQDWQVPLVLIADAITVAETLFDEFRDCYFNALHAILMHLPSLGEDYEDVRRYELAKSMASGVQRDLRIASSRVESVKEDLASKALKRLGDRYSTCFLFGFYPEMLILVSVCFPIRMKNTCCGTDT